MRRQTLQVGGLLSFGALLSSTAGCLASGTVDGDETVSFFSDVRPIFAEKCIECHHDASAIAVSLVSPFDPEIGVIDRENSWVVKNTEWPVIVVPGDPDNSALVAKVEREDLDTAREGSPMPLVPERLPTAEIDAVKSWIGAGAADDDFFRQNVAPIFGTEISLGSRSGRCTGCHYPGAPNGLDVLDPFGPSGLVGVASARSLKLRVAPGDVERSFLVDKIEGTDLSAIEGRFMPPRFERLTPDEVQTIRTWILEGAENN